MNKEKLPKYGDYIPLAGDNTTTHSLVEMAFRMGVDALKAELPKLGYRKTKGEPLILSGGLTERIKEEISRGIKKWGHVDKTPVDFMIAIQEEIGEVAHAINHNEGMKATKQEIVEAIGLLVRLYDASGSPPKGI